MWKVIAFLLWPPWLPFLTQRLRADVFGLCQHLGLVHKTNSMLTQFAFDTLIAITEILAEFLFNNPAG